MLKLKHLSKMINFSVIMAGAGLSAGLVYAANSNLSVDELNSIANSKPVETPYGIAGLGVPPLVMITMGREHNLFSEAYSDYTDIDGDGKLDIMFDPSINYYGIFESNYCYKYAKDKSDLINADTNWLRDHVDDKGEKNNSYLYWYPVAYAKTIGPIKLDIWADTSNTDRKVLVCSGKTENGEDLTDAWSGNFLNYVTSSRIDILKKALYGGTRFSNNSNYAAVASKNSLPVRYKDEKGNYSSLIAHSRVLRDAHAWGKVLGDRMFNHQLTVNDFTGLPATGNDTDAYFFAMASFDYNGDADKKDVRWLPFGMKYGLVSCAGMPGVTTKSSKCIKKENGNTVELDYAYIWDWVSRETNEKDQANGNDAIASLNQKRIDSNGKPTETPLFTGDAEGKNVVVVSCTTQFHDSENCKNYGTESHPIWQPIGLLQQYGEGEKPALKFGLVTGSWKSNLAGGALRANVDKFSNEIYYKNDNSNVNDFISGDINVGAVKCKKEDYYCGIIPTLDRFSIYDRNGAEKGNQGAHYRDCERHVNKLTEMSSGKCRDWGNPIGSILYQTVRYFKNQDLNDDETPNEDVLKIGYVERKPPVEAGSPDYCSKPVSLLLADENISFDSPDFNSNINGGDTGAVESATAKIPLKSGKYFAGGIKSNKDAPDYFIPSLKQVNNLADVIGIAPGVAYSYGSYNVAGVAALYGNPYYGNSYAVEYTGPNGESWKHPISTYVVAMQPNVPQINIPVTGSNGKNTTVTILPFAKTVADLWFDDDGGDGESTAENNKQGQHRKSNLELRKRQSTNQVADFYVETLGPDHGVFRINYEDFQYGSDYDMDWVVEYKYQIINNGGDTYVRVQLKEIDSDAYAPQHAGYVITGVEHSGVYVDLAKSAYDHRSRGSNLYELDNVIGDSAILGCSSANSSLDLKSLINNYDNCLFAQYNEDNYEYEITGNNVANYYNLLNSDGIQQYYYGNRNSIEAYHGGNICESNNPGYAKFGKCRLIGDCYRRFNQCESKSNDPKKTPRSLADIGGSSPADGNYVSSRLFKVNKKDSADSHWLKTPLWYAAKAGLATNLQNTDTNADPENYYLVTNPTKLRDGIINMLQLMDKKFYSGSGFVLNGTTIGTNENPFAYATTYGPKTWYGNLIKLRYDNNYQYLSGSSGDGGWEAANTFAVADVDERLIVTNDYFHKEHKNLVRLYAEDIDYNGLPNSSEYQEYPGKSVSSGAVHYIGHDVFRAIINENVPDETIDENTDYLAYVDKLIRWMHGEHKYEGKDITANANIRFEKNNRTPFRQRIRDDGIHKGEYFVLGDIINSDAVVFNLGNRDDENEEDKVNSRNYVAVGANDGMIHIINDIDGTPVVSYVPSVMLSSLGQLVKQNYNGTGHKAFVDSTPKVFVEKLSSGEKKVYLYGSYGLGFKGGYVLDVSKIDDVAKYSANDKFDSLKDNLLVWEMTEALTINDQDGKEIRTMGSKYIGKQRTAPALILKEGNNTGVNKGVVPYLVFGSGYEHESDNAGLLLVDMLYRDNIANECIIPEGDGERKVSNKEELRNTAVPCITKVINISSNGGTDVEEDPWNFKNESGELVGRKNVITPISDYTSSSINEYATTTESMHYAALYFGDLFGRVWKIDLSNLKYTEKENKYADVKEWGEGTAAPKVIFQTADVNGVAQPITSSVAVGYHPQGGIGLIFGTGSVWTEADRTTTSMKYNESQTLYMIRDMNNIKDINASHNANENPVKRCENYPTAGSRCLIPLKEHVISEDKKNNEPEHIEISANVDKVEGNIYGWYFDLTGFSNSDKGLARIYVDPMVTSSKYMSVAVNVPDYTNTCEDNGSSYIIRGNWSANPKDIVIRTTTKLNYMVNSGNLYIDNMGRLVDIYQGTPAQANGPDYTNSNTLNNRISKTSSWLKLY